MQNNIIVVNNLKVLNKTTIKKKKKSIQALN